MHANARCSETLLIPLPHLALERVLSAQANSLAVNINFVARCSKMFQFGSGMP
jgi:hypothetical protein